MDDVLLLTHIETLVREIREDASGVAEYERQHGYEPRFLDYHSSYLSEPRHATRTINGAVARRRPILRWVERLRREFGPEPTVLDVGCRYGTDSFLLAQMGCRVIGIDPEPDTVAVAGHRLPFWAPYLRSSGYPEFMVGYLEDIKSWPVDSFHGVFAAECLHHCEPVEDALLAARRLMDEKGTAFVLESNAANPAVVLKRNRIAPGARRVLLREGREFRLWGNENIRAPKRWQRLFRDCGFEVRERHFSRHLASELLVAPLIDPLLCHLPGAKLMSIHVAFELNPVEAAVVAHADTDPVTSACAL
ncbi:MAG: class I SAM-dependent methyltransferase [Coriobacteriia bacterium]|nr:class I SAM-dependent methyltransferase [Coriobacteriia bacterium]